MNKILLNQEGAENEDSVLYSVRPEFNRICYNPIRASIIHLLIKSKDLNHALSVEEIANKIGKRHSVVIHHLEKLMEWKVVDVVKSYKYGNRQKRSIWGLNLRYPDWISECYKSIRTHFFSEKELIQITNINKSLRIYT